MAEKRRFGAWLAAAGLALALGACGGGDGDGGGGGGPCPAGQTGTVPNCVPVQTCTQSVVYSDTGEVPARTVFLDQFSVPEGGRLDMTLDWTNASSVMGLYLVPADTCTTIEQFNARSCNFLVRSEPPGPKPRKVSTANFQAGNYRILIANFGEQRESTAVQAVLAKGTGCPALTGTAPSAHSRQEVSPLVVERAEHR